MEYYTGLGLSEVSGFGLGLGHTGSMAFSMG